MLATSVLQDRSQHGFTLIELMVSLAIGLLITSGVLSFYISSMQAHRENLEMSMLNQELNAMLHLIDHDIRRAGFWAGVPGTDDLATNPFMASPNDVVISEKSGETAGSCVIYSYDLNKDKQIGVGSAATAAPFNAPPYDFTNVEQFGFRRVGNAVQMRTGLAIVNEATLDCDSGAWTALSDKSTEITQLSFSLNTQYLDVTTGATCTPINSNCCVTGDACQLIRDISIQMSGRLLRDPSIIKSVSTITHIRNDKYMVMP